MCLVRASRRCWASWHHAMALFHFMVVSTTVHPPIESLWWGGNVSRKALIHLSCLFWSALEFWIFAEYTCVCLRKIPLQHTTPSCTIMMDTSIWIGEVIMWSLEEVYLVEQFILISLPREGYLMERTLSSPYFLGRLAVSLILNILNS